MVTDGVEEIADEEIFAMLWQCATRSDLRTEPIRRLTKFLAMHGWECLRVELLDVINGSKSLRLEQQAAILGAVFSARPSESWAAIEAVLKTDSAISKAVLLEMSYRHQPDFETELAELSALNLVKLYRILATHYPIEEDPPFEPGIQEPMSRRRVAEFRAEIPRVLASLDSQAGCDALALLASEFEPSRIQMQWHLRQSTERWRMKVWDRPTVAAVTQLLLDPRSKLVKTSEDLVEVVVESLKRLQRRVSETNNPLLYDFWFMGRLRNVEHNHGPHSEEHIARRIAAWLQDDLQSRYATVINREVVPRWRQRTDITVEASLRLGRETLVPKVIIEVKGNWHAEVRNACKMQLVDTYLRNQVDAAGIFLVVWFGPGVLTGEDSSRTNRLASQDFQSAAVEVANLATNQRDVFAVQGFTLDCSLPLRTD